MDAGRLQRIEDVFQAVVDLPPGERAEWLARECGSDLSLRAEVQSLLTHYEERPPPGADQPAGKRASARPDRIGPYVLEGVLGEGGCAVVYLAQQTRPVRREVALKVIKLGMDTKQVVSRFEAERQALALMEHPNIAKVYDAGVTERGRPYFAMERVSGVPITDYCDNEQLDTRQRLGLFVQVCDAIQHAHQRGIIHRDIKPSNILVELIDDRPIPKIIDFGVAKAMGMRLTERTFYTEQGQLIGTPEYMSPEQTEKSERKIDTRTDIYSLGVVLYELLTGRLPYDLKNASVYEIPKLIREGKPHRPSSIDHSLRGDVEEIILRALEKKRKNRYQSVDALADDIREYLQGAPIRAKRHRPGYVLRKLLSRHRAAAAVAGAFVVFVGLSAIAFVALYGIAERHKSAAVQARLEAAQARSEAANQTEALRRSRYFNNIALAQSALKNEKTATLVRLLDECPADLRGWEWYYLKRLSDTSIMTLRGHTAGIPTVAFSPDGTKIASGSTDRTIKLWDAETGEELLTLAGHTQQVNSVAFSPDGTQLVSGGLDQTVRLWDVESGTTLHVLRGHKHWVLAVDFSRDGQLIVSASEDSTLKLWDVGTGQEVATLRGHSGPVTCAEFSPDGRRIVSGSHDHTLKLWDVDTSKEVRTLTGHTGQVVELACNKDGSRIVSSGGVRTLRVWDADTGESIMTIETGAACYTRGVAFSPDDQRVVTAVDLMIKAWDVATGEQTSVWRGHRHLVGRVDFSPDGSRIVSADHDWSVDHHGVLKIWDVNQTGEPPTLRGHTDTIWKAVAVSADGSRIASGSWDKTIRVWDAASGQELLKLTGHEGWLESVAFSSDGRRIVSGDKARTIRIWDAETGSPIRVLQGHRDSVVAVVFSPDDRHIASGSWDKTIKVWDAETGQLIRTLAGHSSRVRSASYSPEGRYILSASVDRTIRIWDAETGRTVRELVGHSDEVEAASFSPDGELVASGSHDRTIRLWDAATGEALRTLKGHERPVLSVAFSPDGQRIVSAGTDALINVWDVRTRTLLLTLGSHEAGAKGIAFSPNGRWFVSTNTDHTLRIWDAGPDYVAFSGDEEHRDDRRRSAAR